MEDFILYNGAAINIDAGLSTTGSVWAGFGVVLRLGIGMILIFSLFFLLGIIMYSSSTNKYKDLQKHLPLISFFGLMIRTTIYLPELLIFMLIFIIYFILRPNPFTFVNEMIITGVFGIFLAFSSKLNADPFFFATLSLFSCFSLVTKYSENVLVSFENVDTKKENRKEAYLNVLFSKSLTELVSELGPILASEKFSSIKGTQEKVEHLFKQAIIKGTTHPSRNMAVKLTGTVLTCTGYGLANYYYRAKQTWSIDKQYHESAENVMVYSHMSKTDAYAIKYQTRFDMMVAKREAFVPQNLHSDLVKLGIEKSSDETFMTYTQIGHDVLNAVL
jgi:hypothetical protein